MSLHVAFDSITYILYIGFSIDTCVFHAHTQLFSMRHLLQLFVILIVFFPASFQAQVWEEAAALPSDGRHHPVTFSIDGIGYLVTGNGRPNDFYRYDPVTDEWQQLPDFPGEARGYAYGVTFDGKGYLGFGRANGKNFNDLWEYDPTTEVWTELDTLPGVGRAHPALIAGSGKIWMGLGSGPNGNLNDWWEYDITENEWEQQPDFPSFERHHPYYFEIEGMPYVGFGHGADIFSDFYRFDFENDTWITLNAFPEQGRVAGTQFSYQGKGYILSGQGEDHGDLPEGEFWAYDPDADTWTELEPHPDGGRWAPGSFVLNGEVFLLCGNQQGNGNLNDMWRAEIPQSSVDMKEATSSSDWAVIPSPAVDFIRLNTTGEYPVQTKFSIIALSGERFISGKLTPHQQLYIGHLPAGVYICQVESEDILENIQFVIIP